MSLNYILDAYNIIKSDAVKGLNKGSLEEQRSNLLSLLKEKRPQGSMKNRVTVVFDGPIEGFLWGAPDIVKDSNIEVIFSCGETADQKIEEIVHNHPNPGELIIVTNDKGIRRLVGGSGVKIMPVSEFAVRLSDKPEIECEPEEKTINEKEALDINTEMEKKWLGKDK